METQGLVGDATSSVGEQMQQILDKLDEILTESGCERKDLLHIDIWLADINGDFEAMNSVYDEYMNGIPETAPTYGQGSTCRQLPTRVATGAELSGGFAVELRASAACTTDFSRARL